MRPPTPLRAHYKHLDELQKNRTKEKLRVLRGKKIRKKEK
jgi:hypothetical protein